MFRQQHFQSFGVGVEGAAIRREGIPLRETVSKTKNSHLDFSAAELELESSGGVPK